MKLSARTEYACLAVMYLAENWSTAAPVQIRRIAEEHGIPARFLVQILLQLKGVGLVTSIRGAGGGYRLNKAPTEITLRDVIETMEGDGWPSTSCDKSSPLGETLLSFRQELCRIQRERLESISLAELVEQAAVDAEPMWYI